LYCIGFQGPRDTVLGRLVAYLPLSEAVTHVKAAIDRLATDPGLDAQGLDDAVAFAMVCACTAQRRVKPSGRISF
jgi:hypothetical protein